MTLATFLGLSMLCFSKSVIFRFLAFGDAFFLTAGGMVGVSKPRDFSNAVLACTLLVKEYRT